jgi:hypothetical protein
MRSTKTRGKLQITFDKEEAVLLEDLFGQFTYDTILKIMRDGSYPDALDGNDSETGFEKGGFDEPYDKVVDDLYEHLSMFVDEED